MLESIEAKDLTFRPNLDLPRHRWFPLTEGFSATFVEKCLEDFGATSDTALLDPFAGCGTAPLVAVRAGLRSVFCEVNPLLGFGARLKITPSSDEILGFREWARARVRFTEPLAGAALDEQVPGYPTLREGNRFKRWLFSDDALRILLPLISTARSEGNTCGNLLLLAIAKALQPLCNARRDGKAMRYRQHWQLNPKGMMDARREVLRAIDIIGEDLRKAPIAAGLGPAFHDQSAFEALPCLADRSVDVVVTSPPYLNSRDYTDIYNPDMWLLGFVRSYDEVRELRSKCVDSHVQLPRRMHREAPFQEVQDLVELFRKAERNSWLLRLPEMVGGYFGDLAELLHQLTRILRPGGVAYINVAESAYCGSVIPVLDVLAKLGDRYGFQSDIHIVRKIRRSGQQYHDVAELLEGVVRLRV